MKQQSLSRLLKAMLALGTVCLLLVYLVVIPSYGVSMRSDGVSKLVSQKLDQAMRLAQQTPARDVEHFSGAE